MIKGFFLTQMQFVLRQLVTLVTFKNLGACGCVMVSKLHEQTYTSEFESHWVPLSYGLVPHLSKKKSLVNYHFLKYHKVTIEKNSKFVNMRIIIILICFGFVNQSIYTVINVCSLFLCCCFLPSPYFYPEFVISPF